MQLSMTAAMASWLNSGEVILVEDVLSNGSVKSMASLSTPYSTKPKLIEGKKGR